jgi:hypothetical protein
MRKRVAEVGLWIDGRPRSGEQGQDEQQQATMETGLEKPVHWLFDRASLFRQPNYTAATCPCRIAAIRLIPGFPTR